jgi:hypothetical protein
MATVNIPNDIIFPIPQTPQDAEMQKILSDYFTKIRQTLIEIESKLP